MEKGGCNYPGTSDTIKQLQNAVTPAVDARRLRLFTTR